MIDSHCHLNFNAFRDNYREVVKRAQKSGVEAIICPSTYIESSERAIELAKEFPNWFYAAIGHHPIHVNKHPFDIEKYRTLANDLRVAAVGEVGLDAFREEDKASFNEQKIMLKAFLSLAIEVNKPIILHCRDAYAELITLLKTYPKLPRGVLHCLGTDDIFIAEQFLNLGFLIGFTGMITYPKNDGLRLIVSKLPLERILVETDAPYLPPQNHRGEQNEPAYVREVIETIAKFRGEKFEIIEEATSRNTKELFSI